MKCKREQKQTSACYLKVIVRDQQTHVAHIWIPLEKYQLDLESISGHLYDPLRCDTNPWKKKNTIRNH